MSNNDHLSAVERIKAWENRINKPGTGPVPPEMAAEGTQVVSMTIVCKKGTTLESLMGCLIEHPYVFGVVGEVDASE